MCKRKKIQNVQNLILAIKIRFLINDENGSIRAKMFTISLHGRDGEMIDGTRSR